jgi:hypothetical protein
VTTWKHRIARAAILRPAYLGRFLRERRLTPRHVRQFLDLLVGKNIFER